jgi:hypothetical protein
MNLMAWLRQEEEKKKVRGDWPRDVDGIRAATEIIWQRPLHRYYPDHSVDHSERIIDTLSKLTEDLMLGDNISSTEVYVLLASAYLHDIGMQDERSMGDDLKQIRIHHHELTSRIIIDRYLKQSDRNIPLGFSDLVPVDIVNTIASVAEAHRRTNLQGSQYEGFAYGDGVIHPRLLAALLRLADELDVDSRRVVGMQQLSLTNITAESEFHWHLCNYVSGVQIANGLITVHYRFPERCEESYARIVVPLVRGKIQEEFPILQKILWEHGCKVQMSDEYEMRSVPGLECMSPEVIELALAKRKEKHTKEIVHHKEEIEFCDSMTNAALRHARVENFDE